MGPRVESEDERTRAGLEVPGIAKNPDRLTFPRPTYNPPLPSPECFARHSRADGGRGPGWNRDVREKLWEKQSKSMLSLSNLPGQPCPVRQNVPVAGFPEKKPHAITCTACALRTAIPHRRVKANSCPAGGFGNSTTTPKSAIFLKNWWVM